MVRRRALPWPVSALATAHDNATQGRHGTFQNGDGRGGNDATGTASRNHAKVKRGEALRHRFPPCPDGSLGGTVTVVTTVLPDK
ncbi:unnamed protein product [Lota lota]